MPNFASRMMSQVLAATSLLVLVPLRGAAPPADCGARAVAKVADIALDSLDGIGPVSGLQCSGLLEDQPCCRSMSAQRVLAWLQMASSHDKEQLQNLQSAMANGLGVLEEAEKQDQGCRDLTKAMLEPRLSALQAMKQSAEEIIDLVGHLVVSSLCSFCYPEAANANKEDLVTRQDGPVARQILTQLLTIQDIQEKLSESDRNIVDADPERRCVPEYLNVLATGIKVEEKGGLMDAVIRMRTWPMQRRLGSIRLARDAIEQDAFEQDFFEWGERLLQAALSPAARLAHQLSLVSLAQDKRYHWSTGHPVGRMLWGSAPQDGRGLEDSGSESSADAALERQGVRLLVDQPKNPRNLSRAPDEADTSEDPDSKFGMVVLISNQTAVNTVEGLLTRLQGQRLLLFEDTCGNAMEALGSNCHDGGEGQRKCLAPVHAGRIAVSVKESLAAEARPHVAWRRHSTTRSVAHSVWEVAKTLWGSDSSVWIADFRPAEACPADVVPLSEAVASVPGGKLNLVKDPETMLDLKAEIEGDRKIEKKVRFADTSAAWPHNTPLASRLSSYVEFHRRGLKFLAKDGLDERGAPIGVLVYSCQPAAQCGGHGDRLNGMITAFLLAVLTSRVFLIDSESPLPLELLLEPRAIDWRVQGGVMATAGIRHFSYHDKRQNFEADLETISRYPDQVLVVNTNYRLIRSLFEAPALQKQAQALGLPSQAPPFLAAEVFDVLFAPALVLRQELHRIRDELAPLKNGRFVAIHLRTGEVAYDPARHGSDDLEMFLECARQAERDMGLPPGPETPWLLATDSARVAEAARELPEALSGKLRIPGAKGRVHIDRSELSETIEGAAANYAEWMLFGRAGAVILSRSYFGETAAEVGRARFAYFAPGGGCVRTELSTS
eukprot:TRINITY_DN32049_c0_g1_i1.p1 TRINITY_DN32049_c0_g1~~TRINITY_DN32049_c0_g1_i1.p1  ORF type:complete len:893 (+),score=191.46 TRINITY_DN32049_c0_g1_i1:99-2777(+)